MGFYSSGPKIKENDIKVRSYNLIITIINRLILRIKFLR